MAIPTPDIRQKNEELNTALSAFDTTFSKVTEAEAVYVEANSNYKTAKDQVVEKIRELNAIYNDILASVGVTEEPAPPELPKEDVLDVPAEIDNDFLAPNV